MRDAGERWVLIAPEEAARRRARLAALARRIAAEERVAGSPACGPRVPLGAARAGVVVRLIGGDTMAWTGNETEAPMAGHTPDTPESAARSAASRRAMADARRLEAQWRAGAVPWVEALASDDPYLATLRAYIEDLGGRLVLTAVFPEGAVPRAPAAEAPADGHAAVPAAPPGERDR